MEKILFFIAKIIIDLFRELSNILRNHGNSQVNTSDAVVTSKRKEVTAIKQQKAIVHTDNSFEVNAAVMTPKKTKAPDITEEASAWQGKLTDNMIINGVIFAEILQPPRAYRPFVKQFK